MNMFRRSAVAVAICMLVATGGAFAQSKASPAPSGSVNINTADVADLVLLPGVGKATAQRIVEYRTKAGSFHKVEEMMNVRGIGEKTFAEMKPFIALTGTTNIKAAPRKPAAPKPGH